MIRSRILQLLISIQVVQYGTSTGKLGCLFSSDLCKSTEFCFNDALFGTCQDVYEESNLFRYQLDKTGLHQLEREIRQLILNGYKWDDSYTQCVLQTLLHSIKWQLIYNRDFCSDISPKLALDFLKYLQEYATQDASDIVTTFPPSPIWSGEEDRFRKYKKNNEELTEDELNNLLLSLQTFEESQNDHQESRQNTMPSLFEPDATADRETTLIGDDDDKYSQLMFSDNGRQINLDEVSELLSAIQNGLTDPGEEAEALGKGAQEEDAVEEAELRNKKEWIHFPGDSNDVPKKDGPARPDVTHLIQSKNQPSTTLPQLVTSVFIMKKANYPAAIDLMVTSMPEIDPNADPRNYDVVDTKYTYIKLADKLTDHKGRDFVRMLEKLLRLTAGTFTDIKVDGNQVTFLINPNSQNLNGSAIAALAMSHKEELEKMGFTPISAGVGKETTISVVEADDNSRFFVVTFVFCGCIAAGLLAVVVLYVVRRHARSQAKLQNLTGDNDAEASKDYQDLCRQRMACKSSEKPEPVHVAQRVSSLSQSEASVRSPSSRSSTSSWSEEPAVSNMDISTGHMVLAYMEDHLKTKDRLEQEWAALCAYEAEPCSISIGSLPENKDKNRFPELLPYDHSRVILNNTSNASGLDYINANTITDHDPRNPAYIATQGTLPNTIADFWQMVWEQGSVVIVMLSRLTENGVAMCHRYWPEEGSELSHIYEIHLVSEHIWCDDYLVRSFYLKNLKTNETRTVTQFHFLSWPEMGVPASPKALLDFRRKVNKSYRGRSCPIVVHCSDGAGRTGTYCLIDMVLSRMTKGAKEIDIAATLEHIRDQRAGMVRTKEQFEFALMAVAEEVHAILKALPQ